MSEKAMRTPAENSRNSFLAVCLMAVIAVVLLRTAWVCDDAYITMRTADNFTHGRGLVYNVGERVQSYTHPLWLFLLSGLYAVTNDPYYTLILLSLGTAFAGVVIFLRHFADAPAKAVLGAAAMLFSKAYIDYSGSGMENPLSHLLVIVFLILFFDRRIGYPKLFALSLVASLGILNRFDLALVFLPALFLSASEVFRSAASRRGKAVWILLLGFLPLMAWLVFSLFYYGFFLPNTAYAKLGAGIPPSSLYVQGMAYFLSSLSLDPLTLLATAVGIAAAVFSRNVRQWAVVAGIVLYEGYILSVGGDFMNGRFLTVPFLCAVFLLCTSDVIRSATSLLVPLSAVLIVGLTSPYPPVFSDEGYGNNRNPIDMRGVADERAFYYPITGLLRVCRNCHVPDHPWRADGLAARDDDEYVNVVQSSGFFGFYAGPEKRVVDVYGLVDPLLARLPIRDTRSWRVGHYIRDVPAGYVETLESGENRIENPRLAEFYDHLALITRGDLFDLQRLAEIIKINTGQYDYLLVNSGVP